MQNKPNLLDTKMNVNKVLTNHYKNQRKSAKSAVNTVFCRTLCKKALKRAFRPKKCLTFGLKYALIKALLWGRGNKQIIF